MLNLWGNLCGLLGPVQAKLQYVDQIAHTRKPLCSRKSHETPVFVVVIEARIEDAVDAKPAGARNQAKGSQPSLRTRNGHVVARRNLPLDRKSTRLNSS